jgi:hypothetical protein
VSKDEYMFRIGAYALKYGPVLDCQGTIVDMNCNKLTMPEGGKGNVMFMTSTKYFLWAGKVLDEKCNVVFDATVLGDVKLGLSDDYIFAQKNVNGIVTSAAYDLTGNKIIDNEYKDIFPVDKETFLVTNNGNKFGVINKEKKELVPMGQNQMYLPLYDYSNGKNGAVRMFMDYKTGMGRLSFVADDKGTPTRSYYDLTKKEIAKDVQIGTASGQPALYEIVNGNVAYRMGSNHMVDIHETSTAPWIILA